ncbi:GNAT family N-acetyltransferase [Glutamicibacter sp. MNS18]|uniref:GNAT family N-acetyltransferase n=1 Tax=Glutamicibacter sp. MNS18 TaxID=2989817 RepID=UPI002235CD21|nr:GNAT family N-acetyltransferase [Glutamicibacter sp. MNS18]MCW4466959.1 GNAT family N-acetyltransferase [Glutamicibacter sp. MNS18]
MYPETDVPVVAARHHYFQTHLVRARMRGETASLVWARTGAQHPELNRVLWFTAPEAAYGVARMEGVPALWSLWPGSAGFDAALAAARGHGLVAIEEEPLMALPLARNAKVDTAAGYATSEPDVRITACRSLKDLERWVRFWAAEDVPAGHLAGVAAELAPFAGFGRTGRAVEGRAVTHFLALHGETVIGCSAAVVTGASAAVEHVIVDARWRSRGIGSRLTNAAIHEASKSGSEVCVLTASPDGEGLYRRLGFLEVCRVLSYSRA